MSWCSKLFDHLVGECQDFWRHIQAEHLGSFEIDDEVELGRLHDGEVGGLRAFENTAGVDSDLPIRIRKTRGTSMRFLTSPLLADT
jgi:hypothetical protein